MGDCWAQGDPPLPCPSEPGKQCLDPAGWLLPATAPYQHLPAEPAQMLQECGSATTRYCRNALRVGKGQAGAVLPLSTHIPHSSPNPQTQRAAACTPYLGRGPSPLCDPGQAAWAVGALIPRDAKSCFLSPLLLPLGWEMSDLG